MSWLPSTFDSVSDVILNKSQLKRNERVTQSLSENRSKRVSGSSCGGKMYQEQGRMVPGLALLIIVTGATEGSRDAMLVCTPSPWGGREETEGAIQSRDKFMQDGALRQGKWTYPARQ